MSIAPPRGHAGKRHVLQNLKLKNVTGVLEYMLDTYFKELRPGEPIMIVTNLLKEEEVGRVHSGRYEYQLHTTWYIGLLASDEPLVEVIEGSLHDRGAFLRIRVDQFIEHGAWPLGFLCPKPDPKAIVIPGWWFLETDVTKPFKVPSGSFAMDRAIDRALAAKGKDFDDNVMAITVAVGFAEIEKLCEREGKEATRLYLKARRKFGLSAVPVSTTTTETRDVFKLETLRKLKEVEAKWREAGSRSKRLEHAEHLERLIEHAGELGLDDSKHPDISWGLGLYVRPHEYIVGLVTEVTSFLQELKEKKTTE